MFLAFSRSIFLGLALSSTFVVSTTFGNVDERFLQGKKGGGMMGKKGGGGGDDDDDDDDGGMGGKKGGKKGGPSVLEPEEVCLLEGLEFLLNPLASPTMESDAAFLACNALTGAACMSGVFDIPMAEDAFECWAMSGFGSYPLVTQAFRQALDSTSQAGIDMQEGALNGEAWCHVTDLSATATTAAEKGIINGYEIDLTGTQDLTGFSYDYFVRSCEPTDTPCGDQFYLNIYLRQPGSDRFYDCRLDYLPPDTNGVPGEMYNFAIDLMTTPGVVDQRDGADCTGVTSLQTAYDLGFVLSSSACYIWALNVGDTALREGLGGCYDNIQLTTTTGMEVYDLQSNAP